MAPKTSWHGYGTKLRLCHPMYKALHESPVYLLTRREEKQYRNSLPLELTLTRRLWLFQISK